MGEEPSVRRQKTELLVSVAAAIILLSILLFWTIMYPLTWLAVVSAMLAYVVLDAMQNGLKWIVKHARRLAFAPFHLFAGTFLLVIFGVLLGEASLKQIVNYVLSPTFGGSSAVGVLTAVAPTILVLYMMTQSEEFQRLRRSMEIIEVPALTESDEEALRTVKKVVSAFGKLDIVQVEAACNRVREEYLAKWKAETGETVENSPIKRSTAIEEAEPKFELWKPTRVTIVMLDQSVHSINSSSAPQRTSTYPSNRQSVIYTLMRWVTKHNNQFYAVDSATQQMMSTLADSTIHELLHASGDLPPAKHDGVVRQTWIGVKAVRSLLSKE